MRNRFVSVLRSVAAVVGGYLTVALGTILTFNVLVGQLTVDSGPLQLILGTIGAALSGLAGGLVAGIVAPRFPFAHAAGVLIFLIHRYGFSGCHRSGTTLVRSCRKQRACDHGVNWGMDNRKST